MEQKARITKSSLIADLEAGLKRPQICEKYGLTPSALQKGMKLLGLDKLKAKKPLDVVFVDDTIEEVQVNLPDNALLEVETRITEINENGYTDECENAEPVVSVSTESPAVDPDAIFGVTAQQSAEAMAEAMMASVQTSEQPW